MILNSLDSEEVLSLNFFASVLIYNLRMTSAKILLVEDDPAVAQTIVFALEQAGHTVSWSALARPALNDFAVLSPDLVLLDVGLPDLSGFEACRMIRQSSQVPIVFLTAQADEIDKIQGFEVGADDYLAKPFSPRELVARVRAILRREFSHAPAQAHSGQSNTLLNVGPFQLNREQLVVMVNRQPITLTPSEFRLLEHFMNSPHQVFSRDQLLDVIQVAGVVSGDRTIDTHIKSLRAKISGVLEGESPIRTHRGFGYCLQVN
jgi:two-component system, OmpR family, catabolic regulation response regulator CreB